MLSDNFLNPDNVVLEQKLADREQRRQA